VNESVVAVVPIRSLLDGKTRLASVLDLEARQRLIRRTAAGVIEVARNSDSLATVLVVSPDAETLDWASALGSSVVALPQPDHWPGLNGAIDAGREWAIAHEAETLLSLFADLPLLAPADIRGITAQPQAVVLGADRRHEGTNALLLRLSGSGAGFRFAFGAGSLAKHRDEALRLGLESTVYDSPGIGFDLDTPDDWDDLLAERGEVSTLPLPFPTCRGKHGTSGKGNEVGFDDAAAVMAKCGACVG
jgi:2-phospho-L-lactate/phosphoenolpyruvate guanylyltransferase